MQTAKILQFRKSEETRHLITQGMLDYEEQRFTAEMERLKADLPPTIDPGYKDRNKPRPHFLKVLGEEIEIKSILAGLIVISLFWIVLTLVMVVK